MGWWENVRSGEIGSAPIIAALVIITIFFYEKNSNFVGATNFNNLITQMAGTAVTAFGVVFVLLIGEIDLSVGYVGGLAGVVVAELQLPGSGHQFPGLVAILLALLVGAARSARFRDRSSPSSGCRPSSSHSPETSPGRA